MKSNFQPIRRDSIEIRHQASGTTGPGAASFTAYIDESGDEGFVFLPGEKGSSRWLVLAAMVFRKSKDLEAVRVTREVRTLATAPMRTVSFSPPKDADSDHQTGKKMQAPSSSVPPIRAANVATGLYKPCACLR